MILPPASLNPFFCFSFGFNSSSYVETLFFLVTPLAAKVAEQTSLFPFLAVLLGPSPFHGRCRGFSFVRFFFFPPPCAPAFFARAPSHASSSFSIIDYLSFLNTAFFFFLPFFYFECLVLCGGLYLPRGPVFSLFPEMFLFF